MITEVFAVEGMACHSCAANVTDELLELEAVTSVDVDLVPGGASRVAVSSEARLSHADVAAAVAQAGYRLTDPPIREVA